MSVFTELAASLRVSNQLPLDEKTYFPTLAQMRNLGLADAKAFQYYEYMTVRCVETGIRYTWQEVEFNYSGGVLENNFRYPANVFSNNIDYSLRYFNFVPEGASTGLAIGNPFVIFKGYTEDPENSGSYLKNQQAYLEENDIVMGHLSHNLFIIAKYLGGPVTSPSSFSRSSGFDPTNLNTPMS